MARRTARLAIRAHNRAASRHHKHDCEDTACASERSCKMASNGHESEKHVAEKVGGEEHIPSDSSSAHASHQTSGAKSKELESHIVEEMMLTGTHQRSADDELADSILKKRQAYKRVASDGTSIWYKLMTVSSCAWHIDYLLLVLRRNYFSSHRADIRQHHGDHRCMKGLVLHREASLDQKGSRLAR